MKTIDDFLNNLTMYRLLYAGLGGLALIAILFSATGVLQFSAIDMTISLAVAMLTATVVGVLLKWLFGGTITHGSMYITALIIFFLFRPGNDLADWAILATATTIALASKYVIAWRKRHILNPAAIGAVLVGWFGLEQAIWWVASESLVIFVTILGFLILRKLHRFELFFSFAVAALVTLIITTNNDTRSAIDIVRDGFVSFPILFLGTVMLTEPMTTPSPRNWQVGYGALVGVLFGSGLSIGGLYMTPELALVIGNLVILPTVLRRLVVLKLAKKTKIGPSLVEYRFQPNVAFPFTPGQYLEVTLPGVGFDARGNRRSFSIASAPTEDEVILGVKHNDPSSAFKKSLLKLKPGEDLLAHQLQGSFVLPKDPSRKLVFIAGGIGVTPFRSMLQNLVDAQESRDIVMFYQVNKPDEIVFKQTIKASLKRGVKPVFVLSAKEVPRNWKWETGFITEDMLRKYATDYKLRTYYISGPPGMIAAYRRMLNDAGVSSNNIITDYFSGY